MITCHYCSNPAQLVNGKQIYPFRTDLAALKFWRCAPCNAWVGCHPGTEKPLGILAKAELRKLKSQVHAAFDPTWRNKKRSRTAAYRWLAEGLGISGAKCHIGMFTEDMCRKALEFMAGETA